MNDTTDLVPAPELTIESSRIFRGPNVWHYKQVVQLVVDLGVLEQFPTNLLPGFADTLHELLPGLWNHHCSRGRKGGFVERLHEGTWVGHVAEHVAIELQTQVGHEARRGKTRSVKGEPGKYNVIYAYQDENVGLAAGALAVRLVNHLVSPEEGFELRPEIDKLIKTAERYALGPSTQAIVDEAVTRDIPWQRLNTSSLIQLGQGVHQQRIRATMTSRTSNIAVDIASNKNLTLELLGNAGLPVPRSVSVRTLADAQREARRIGYPVVIKPLDGNHGRGVKLNLADDEAIAAVWDESKAESRRGQMIVESFITGRDYRCLVIGGQIAAIAERVPAHVVGDGEHTVSELVEITNADPRRGVGHEKVLTRISVNQAAIDLVAEQGLTMDGVPEQGQVVQLTLTGNMSTGGISIDRTFEAHPENIEIAEEAARLIGLDIAGIDFICPDITQPVRETGGGICEVNAAPGFRMHTHPTIGDPQYIAKPVIDMLFPAGTPSRIPIVAVTGTNGKTTTSRMIAHIFKGIGRKVGMTSTDGVVIDERLVIRADASGPRSARMVLQNPRVDFAVLEVARGGILREGLGYDYNDVAVVLNVTPDHLGIRGINTLSQLAAVKQVVVEAVPRHGYAVLNADDPHVAKMRRACSGRVIWFTMKQPGDPARDMVEDHCRRGGQAVVLDSSEMGDRIMVRDGRRSMQIAWTHLLPATFGGRALMNVQNSMAAAAAAYVSGASLHDIRQGLRTFNTSYYLAPGRLNEITIEGRTVIIDYCHNAPGMVMLGDFVDRTAVEVEQTSGKSLRRIGVIATAGDRRDDDIAELGRVAARHFDHIIVREDAKTRGRAVGETARLTVAGIEEAMAQGARCSGVETVLDELEATRHAMALSSPGDLVVICPDSHRSVMAELETYGNRATPTDKD
ncbi:cyanophycin synthetase [Aestuariimicrobium soli]|uniref:cyanophycin synthetase n=1 Tax=Aestuariimicrobium soli TaxID=2035834 RepID=UPI003EBBF1B7